MENTLTKLIGDSRERILVYVNFTNDAKKIFLEKGKKYGPSWIVYRPQTMRRRIWNKGLRLRSFQDKDGIQFVKETPRDNFSEIYIYSLMGVIITERMFREGLDTVSQINLEEKIDVEKLFSDASTKCHELMVKKDHDYNGAWVTMNISDIIDEIMAKLFRAYSIIKNRSNIPPEEFKKEIIEIFMDTANYGAFATILIDLGVDPME